MKTMVLGVLALVIVAAAGMGLPLAAGGFGLSFDVTAGMQDLKLGSIPTTMENEKNSHSLGFTLVYDTALARDRLFNYRLNLGYANRFTDTIAPFEKNAYHQVVWSNTFGIAFYRNRLVRLWAGPLIALSYQVRTYKEYMALPLPIPFIGVPLLIDINTSYQIHHFNFMGGAVVGVNVNPGDRVTVSLTCGVQGGGGVGIADGRTTVSPAILPVVKFALADSQRSTSTGVEFVSRISVLYRLGDVYGAEAPKQRTGPLDEKLMPEKKSAPEKPADEKPAPVPETKPAPEGEGKAPAPSGDASPAPAPTQPPSR